MRPFACLLAALAFTAAVSAQTRAEFEVASIRPSTAPVDRVGVASVGIHVDGSQVRVSGLSLREYVITAYRLPPQQIAGPDWLGQQRFDLAAKIPDGVAATRVPEMLQSLLADRFQMKAHRETKDLPVYALVVAPDGPKLRSSPPLSDSPSTGGLPGVNVAAGGRELGASADLGGGSSFNLANNRIEMRRMTAEAMARLLTRLADRPMVDATGLTGTYDVDLEVSEEQYRALLIRAALNNGAVFPPQILRLLDAGGDPFSDALHQVGLALDPRKAPLETLVIDSILKAPTDN